MNILIIDLIILFSSILTSHLCKKLGSQKFEFEPFVSTSVGYEISFKDGAYVAKPSASVSVIKGYRLTENGNKQFNKRNIKYFFVEKLFYAVLFTALILSFYLK